MNITGKNWVLCCLLVSCLATAVVQRVSTECQLYRAVNKKSIAIVFFYQDDTCMRKGSCYKNSLCASMAALERLSRLPWYHDGDCTFVAARVEKNEMCSYVASLGISCMPCYVIFYNSVVARDEHGACILLDGYAQRNVLEDFIDRYAGGTIEDTVKERAEQRRIAREEARLRYEYYAPYLYWGYPYWGCWGAPYFGVGCGCRY
jgi:hypothetical protein